MVFGWRYIRGVHKVGVNGHPVVIWIHCWNTVKMLSFPTEFNGCWCNLDEVFIKWNKLGAFRNLWSNVIEWSSKVIVKTQYQDWWFFNFFKMKTNSIFLNLDFFFHFLPFSNQVNPLEINQSSSAQCLRVPNSKYAMKIKQFYIQMKKKWWGNILNILGGNWR